MTKLALGAVGVLMMIAGAVFTMQGLGYVTGSPMTNTSTWAILGPIIVALGVAVLVAARRR